MMKKFLALFLVLVMALSCALVACKKDPADDTDGGDDDDFGALPVGTTTPSSTTDPNGSISNELDLTWRDAAGKVYVLTNLLNIRKSASFDASAIVDSAKFKDELTRVKYNDLWTVISIDDKEYYVATKYVTDKKADITFTDEERTTVYVNVSSKMNLRSQPFYIEGDSSNLATTVSRGTALIRTGINETGNWVRVEFTYTKDGKETTIEAYCRPGNISTEKPSDSAEQTPGGIG